MVHNISYTKIEFKNVAAQPTGWEVGGGPPGAAQSPVMASFKRLSGNMFKLEA